MSTEPSKPRVRFSLRGLLVVVFGCAILFASCRALSKFHLFSGEVEVARFDCGKGRFVVISANYELLEPYHAVYYTVYENGKSISPKQFFYSTDWNPLPEFTYETAANGDLVGVSFANAPRFFVIIYDFVSHNGWSRDTGSVDSREAWKRYLERRRLGLGNDWESHRPK